MTDWPRLQEGEQVTAFEDGEPFLCTVVREDFAAGDLPTNPSRVVLRRKGTLQLLTRDKDQVERDGAGPVRPDEEPTT